MSFVGLSSWLSAWHHTREGGRCVLILLTSSTGARPPAVMSGRNRGLHLNDGPAAGGVPLLSARCRSSPTHQRSFLAADHCYLQSVYWSGLVGLFLFTCGTG